MEVDLDFPKIRRFEKVSQREEKKNLFFLQQRLSFFLSWRTGKWRPASRRRRARWKKREGGGGDISKYEMRIITRAYLALHRECNRESSVFLARPAPPPFDRPLLRALAAIYGLARPLPPPTRRRPPLFSFCCRIVSWIVSSKRTMQLSSFLSKFQ